MSRVGRGLSELADARHRSREGRDAPAAAGGPDGRHGQLRRLLSELGIDDKTAKAHVDLRSYISTARKNGLGARDALGRLAAGQPLLPAPAPI